MQLDIKATNLELTDAIRAYVQTKMDALDAEAARFGGAVRGEVEVGKASQHHKTGPVFRAEVHIRLPGKLVYASEAHEDLYTAIGNAVKDAEKQMLKYRGKMQDSRKRGRNKGEGV
ncbi:MAG: ribosome-associated translation inhibitor RaiA [Patescibacteria group bacterium]